MSDEATKAPANLISAPKKELEYFFSEKNKFLVVSFVGPLTKIVQPSIEKFKSELLQKTAENVVLNFHDVSDLDLVGVSELTHIQKSLRERKANIRLCFLRPEFKQLLLDRAAARREEVAANLAEALTSLKAIATSSERT